MARSLADCAALWLELAGPRATARLRRPAERPIRSGDTRLDGVRLAVSPRVGRVDLDSDVADGFEAALAACRSLGAELIEAPASDLELDVGEDFLDVLCAELIVYHRRFDDRRELYRPSLREWMELSEQRPTSAEAYVAAQTRRRELQAAWIDWFDTRRIAALIEPTVPVVAPLRGDGYDHARSDVALLLLTYYWDWTGFPAVALPAGVGSRSGLPVGVSFIGPAGNDRELLSLGIALQAELGIPVPPGF
jgi:mandelamide amidase